MKPVEPLQWCEERAPNDYCPYNHCIAETPFGRFVISWKGWKDYPDFVPEEQPWMDGSSEETWCPCWDTLEEAKAACEAEYRRRLMLALDEDLASNRLRFCPAHGQQPANAWGCPECVREMREQLAQSVDPLAAKALDVLEALARRAASGQELTIKQDRGYGTAILIADGGHTHVGGDYWESAEENFKEFVREMHDQLCCNRGLSWVSTEHCPHSIQ